MRAEFLVELPMLTFAEQMKIDLAHEWAILIWITHDELGSVPIGQAHAVVEVAARARHASLGKTVPMNFLPGQFSAVARDVCLARVRAEDMCCGSVSQSCAPQ